MEKNNRLSVLSGQAPSALNAREQEYLKDKWQLNIVGITPPPYIRVKQISFNRISQSWLRQVAKCFIRLHLTHKAYYTLQQYLRSIGHFSRFLGSEYPEIQPHQITRSVMLKFIEHIHCLDQNNEAKNKVITHIKILITQATDEGWEDFTKEKIMYRQDRLPVKRAIPRHIPPLVIDQLDQHIHKLSGPIRRATLLLQHTGRRVGEICALKRDCLMQDNDGDYLLRYYEFKMKKEELIPINKTTLQAIKDQEQWLLSNDNFNKNKHLFPCKKDLGPINPSEIRDALNMLVVVANITGPNGEHWWFQPHQFRHTVGTNMINSGTPVHIVQRYLGHASPEMTMNYAHIQDSTMKDEYLKYQGKLVNHQGDLVKPMPSSNLPQELKWLKANILAQALPNGYCALPIQQGGCPHANACLSCSHFRTSTYFMPQHKQQQKEFKQIIGLAKEQGWARQAEMNTKQLQNLDKIVSRLEDQKIGK